MAASTRIGEWDFSATHPATAVSVSVSDIAAVPAAARRVYLAGADIVEWRLDALTSLDASQIVQTAGQVLTDSDEQPLILTLRTAMEGGQFAGDDSEYRRAIADLIDYLAPAATPAYSDTGSEEPDDLPIILDIEDARAGTEIHRAAAAGIHTVASQHLFYGSHSQSELERALIALTESGAEIVKLAVMSNNEADTDALLAATATVAKTVECPLITMSMGEAGRRSRIDGYKYGSALTFAYLDEPSAPGQPPLTELLATR
ncbi:MAG: type I 3-dehydroquinate dehydratase [Varibaculum sp.]|nr:type I 3-dehydroquinate dehydratase [Varibaculum sp.]